MKLSSQQLLMVGDTQKGKDLLKMLYEEKVNLKDDYSSNKKIWTWTDIKWCKNFMLN